MSEYIVLQVSSFHGFDMECLLVFPAEFLFTSAYKGLFVNKEHPPMEMPACVSYSLPVWNPSFCFLCSEPMKFGIFEISDFAYWIKWNYCFSLILH